ncbi:MAG: IPT/TIG domain-containing protein [Candidatus Solibacter sp.]
MSAQTFVPYVITTVAGTRNNGDGGRATQAMLYQPKALAADAVGNVYIADTSDNHVRKVAPDGTISTVAGNGLSGFAGDGGLATSAALGSPAGVAVDSTGNLYVSTNNRIRRISAAGIITTVADTGQDPNLKPLDLAFDSAGSLYFLYNSAVRKVTADGKTVPVAGDILFNALFRPVSVFAMDEANNLYLGSSNNGTSSLVLKQDPAGKVTLIAGGGTSFGEDGPATAAYLNSVTGLAVNSNGTVWISEVNRIRRIAGGVISTVAGTVLVAGNSGDGGPAKSALVSSSKLSLDRQGNLMLVDSIGHKVRRIATDGIIASIAGGAEFIEGAMATDARLSSPYSVVVARDGTLYLSDSGRAQVYKIAPNGAMTIVAGTGKSGFSGDNGPAKSAQLSYPKGLAVDSLGTLYIADSSRIRAVTPDGLIRTVAGSGVPVGVSVDGPATAASINVDSVSVDRQGTLYFADIFNRMIRKVSPDGLLKTLVDKLDPQPSAVALSPSNGVYYALQHIVKMLSSAGTSTVVAGGGVGPGDGQALSTFLMDIQGMTFDSSGNLYVADGGVISINYDRAGVSHRVRMVTPSGSINTIAGTGTSGFDGDGGLATSAQLSYPTGLAVDSSGAIYIADEGNHLVRKLVPDPKVQLRVVSGNRQSGTVSSTLADPMTVQLVDGNGKGLPNTAVTFAVTSGSAIIAPLAVRTAADGNATATLALGSTPGVVTVTATVTGIAPVTLTATAIAKQPEPGTAPAITPGGVVGAGLSVPAVSQISPNSIVTIYGRNFAPAGSSARVVRPSDLVVGLVPTNLAGVCVQIASQRANMLLVTPSQLNVQVPSLTAYGQVPVQVIVNCGENNEIKSEVEIVPHQAASPEFFFFVRNADGKNPVAAVNAVTGSYVGVPQLIPGGNFIPAKPGDTLTLFLTGLGMTDPWIVAGQLPETAARTLATTTVMLGQTLLRDADVLYSGVAPGYAGLYQINIRLPVAADGDLPVRVSVGEYSTPLGAYVSIRQQP